MLELFAICLLFLLKRHTFYISFLLFYVLFFVKDFRKVFIRHDFFSFLKILEFIECSLLQVRVQLLLSWECRKGRLALQLLISLFTRVRRLTRPLFDWRPIDLSNVDFF